MFAHAERFRFHVEVCLGVDIGGVERDVAEPSTDGVDIDTGAQKMGGRAVAPISPAT